MIEHTRRPAAEEPPAPPVPEPDVPQGPMELIDVIDLDFNLGPGDTLGLSLYPGDSLEQFEDVFVVRLAANNEEVEIKRSDVRWRSTRTRKEARAPRSFDPAELAPQE